MLERDRNLSTEQKALTINLDEQKYGTIVEIGAGQEVARQFFAAGAAAGTIAKTASAYDMQVSDEIYGKAQRYVGRERLRQMLDHEYDLLIERLLHRRSRNTTYFAYAATVTAQGWQRTEECHGWIGLRVQMYPGAAASEIIMHVRMMDDSNRLQSEALGVLGVNLMHGAFYHALKPKWIIEGLLDNLDTDRIEIDLIEFSGPYFEETDNRLMNLHLVRSWCCRAVMFDDAARPVVPGEELRKKDTMVMRGSFNPPTRVHVDMMDAAVRQFTADGVGMGSVSRVAELTMAELGGESATNDASFLVRVELLAALGYSVLISDYLRFFRLRSWIRRYTNNHIGIVLSVHDLAMVFDAKYYDGVEGGLLEAMGKLFSDNTRVYVYPGLVDDRLVTLEEAPIPASARNLLAHLVEHRAMVPATGYCEEHLHIVPAEVLREIASGDGDWIHKVPEPVAERIRAQNLFGLPAS